MKKLLIILVPIWVINSVHAQQNVLNSTGNVGIGTTTPVAKLDVTGGTTKLSGSSGDNWFPYSDGNNYHRALNHIFTDNTTAERLRITGGGNVGIGTSYPSEKLHVNGKILSQKVTVVGQSAGANYMDGGIEIREVQGVSNSQTSDNYAPRLTFHWGNIASRSISMASNGNIKFNLQNSTTTYANIEVGNVISSSGFFMRPDNIGISFSTGNGTNTSYGNFNFNDIVGNTRIMTILNTGSVGIGTTNPGDFKLAVNGNIKAKEVKVSTQNWSDFVFANDYKLPSLIEVEKYITDNKHLPQIPSEKEVLANGIELGVMNAKLLQKIEELTLYIIQEKKEREKEIKELREVIEKLTEANKLNK